MQAWQREIVGARIGKFPETCTRVLRVSVITSETFLRKFSFDSCTRVTHVQGCYLYTILRNFDLTRGTRMTHRHLSSREITVFSAYIEFLRSYTCVRWTRLIQYCTGGLQYGSMVTVDKYSLVHGAGLI